MSWELVEHLEARFPEVEPFPRREPSPAEEPPAHKHDAAKAPVHHVPGAVVPAGRLLEICRVVRDEAPFLLDYCSLVTGVDRPEAGQIEVVYHLFSMTAHHELLLKVRVPRDDPRVPSVSGIWSAANWHERETYDLFGIAFDGHPDLRRIMMTEDWVGYPLRKDYVYEDPQWLVDLVAQRRREAGLS